MRSVLLASHFFEYAIELANALAKQEEVMLILLEPLEPDYYVDLLMDKIDSSIKTIVLPNFRQYHPANLPSLIKVVNSVKDFDPDVLHLLSEHLWQSLALAWLTRYPTVATIHDPVFHEGQDNVWSKLIRYITLKFTDEVIVHGQKLKELFIQKYRWSTSKVYVIAYGHFGIFTQFAQADVQEERAVLFFGSIQPYKGLEYFIQCQPIVSKEVPQVKFIIAGSGDLTSEQKAKVSREPFCLHNYYISPKQIAYFMQMASIVVLPYVDASQTGVIPIAYAFRKPVVATTVGSLPEIVRDGETGYLVPPRNAQKLAEAVIKLLKDERLRKQMGENGYKMIKEDLDWDRIAQKTMQVYNKALRNCSEI